MLASTLSSWIRRPEPKQEEEEEVEITVRNLDVNPHTPVDAQPHQQSPSLSTGSSAYTTNSPYFSEGFLETDSPTTSYSYSPAQTVGSRPSTPSTPSSSRKLRPGPGFTPTPRERIAMVQQQNSTQAGLGLGINMYASGESNPRLSPAAGVLSESRNPNRRAVVGTESTLVAGPTIKRVPLSSASTSTKKSEAFPNMQPISSRSVQTPLSSSRTHTRTPTSTSILSASSSASTSLSRTTTASSTGATSISSGSHTRDGLPPVTPSLSFTSPQAEPTTSSTFGQRIKAKLTDSTPRALIKSKATPFRATGTGTPSSGNQKFISSQDIAGDNDWDTVREVEDEEFLEQASLDQQGENVRVSIRVRPLNPQSSTDSPAWDITSVNSLQVKESFKRVGAKDEWVFDNVLSSGSNKYIYDVTARQHVKSAMEGYNAVIFAYGQTASGKTFTLSGEPGNEGIIGCAVEDVFAFIRKDPEREYLLRASYLEIYNEVIKDLLDPASSTVEIRNSPHSASEIILTPLREVVVATPSAVRDILATGNAARRTGKTDWNERSSRSHSVFRLVIESRPRSDNNDGSWEGELGLRTPGGRSRKGKATTTSVLNLIDLAGSEKATSDAARAAEGKYINKSLLALKNVISAIAENEITKMDNHVRYRDSKLTRMLQSSLSGDSKVSVICTLNPSAVALSETNSTLQFASGLKMIKLRARKKEFVDPHALIQKYQLEIAELKAQLAAKESRRVEGGNRRLSRREETNMKEQEKRLNTLSQLILTNKNVLEDLSDIPARPVSPTKFDFDSNSEELQREVALSRIKIEELTTKVEGLEEELLARPMLPAHATSDEKDALITELTKKLAMMETVCKGYEEMKATGELQVESIELIKERNRADEADRLFLEMQRELERERAKSRRIENEHKNFVRHVQKTIHASNSIAEEGESLLEDDSMDDLGFGSLGISNNIPNSQSRLLDTSMVGLEKFGGAESSWNLAG